MTEQEIAGFTDGDGNVITIYWTLDGVDAQQTRRVVRLRVVNGGADPFPAWLVQGEGDALAGLAKGGLFPTGDSYIAIPTDWNDRLTVTRQADGSYGGVEQRLG